MLQVVINKAWTELSTMQEVITYLVDVQDTDLYTCTYPYTVKGSRVYKPSNVLNVQNKVCLFSMV